MQFLDPLKLALASPLKLKLKQRSVIARQHGLLSPSITFMSDESHSSSQFLRVGESCERAAGLL